MKVTQSNIEEVIERVVIPGLKTGSYAIIAIILISILMKVLGFGRVWVSPIPTFIFSFLYHGAFFILDKRTLK